ncbi:MAG TPA: hypothetical protein VML75_26755 [Kofleriaceae bacterium]|nr:hypothetical protein [Kofleriaceae bacterium]
MQLRTLFGALALLVVASLVATGCETHKGKDQPAPPPPAPAKAIAAGSETPPDETKDVEAPDDPPPPEPERPVAVPDDVVAVAPAGTAGPSCADAAANLLAIIEATVTAQSPDQLPMFAAQKAQVRAQFIGQCTVDDWSAEARACVKNAKSETDLAPCQDLLPNKRDGAPPPKPADPAPTVPTPPMADTPPAPAVPLDRGGLPCEQVARNVAVLVRQVQDVPPDQSVALLDNITGLCTSSGWSRKVKECFAVATRPEDLSECQRYANVEAQQQAK